MGSNLTNFRTASNTFVPHPFAQIYFPTFNYNSLKHQSCEDAPPTFLRKIWTIDKSLNKHKLRQAFVKWMSEQTEWNGEPFDDWRFAYNVSGLATLFHHSTVISSSIPSLPIPSFNDVDRSGRPWTFPKKSSGRQSSNVSP